MQFDRILVPIDFTTASRAALDHARAIASEVHVVHVLQPIAGFTRGPQRILDAEDALRDWSKVRENRCNVAIGDPGAAVARIAEELNASLVLLAATSHDSGLGPVAERILRRSSVPVLVFPAGSWTPKPFRPVFVAVAHDLSPAADAALRVAAAIAAQPADLQVFHVLETIDAELPSLIWPARDDADRRAWTRRELKKTLTEQGLGEAMVRVLQPDGRIARCLLAATREGASDLVVCGRRGHTGLMDLLIGSVALRVCRQSHIPVLVVPEESE